MRIATWNINGLRARLEFLLGWLEARRPDIIGLMDSEPKLGVRFIYRLSQIVAERLRLSTALTIE